MEETKRTESASVLSNLVIYWSQDWRISSDEHQWIVQQRGHFDKKANAYYWRPKGFFHDLCKAIGFIVQRQIRALPVDIPADPGCQLILELEDKLDQQLEALCQRLLGDAGSPVTVEDIGKPKQSPSCTRGRRHRGRNEQREVAE